MNISVFFKKIQQSRPFYRREIKVESIVALASVLISLAAFCYFYFHGQQNLSDYDAVARLNIARKVFDSITPGVGQLGGIWLPFPQVLMIPFTLSNILWHTGLAGYLVSGPCFVLGAFYLYKLSYLLTKKTGISLLVWAMYVGNSNILLLQTMALSEVLFLSSLILVLYFLSAWVISHRPIDFVMAALSVVVITLTRYEGYFVFVGTVLVVAIECFRLYRRDQKEKIEGMILVFLTLSGFGIFCWCIYSFLFYNDPLYWLHLYANGRPQVSTATSSVVDLKSEAFAVKPNSLSTALKTYASVINLMNGETLTILGVLGLLSAVVSIFMGKKNRQQRWHLLPVLVIALILFAFFVYGYQRGFVPQIHLPPKLIPVSQRKSFTIYSDSNIRYGVVLAPLIVLFAGVLAAKNKVFTILVICFFALQLYTMVVYPNERRYTLPVLWQYSQVTGLPWFVAHYDHGQVLVSTNVHEDFIFQSGLPYKTFIYEGTREYWMNSLDNPARYARWVIYDDAIQGDMVNYFLTDKGREILKKQFTLVYDNSGFRIYRKRS